MNTREIVKDYICKMVNGDDITLEQHVRNTFSGQDKVQLRKYCKNQEIYYKKASAREMLLQKIYGACKTSLSYKILLTSDAKNETIQSYYKKIYEREYKENRA